VGLALLAREKLAGTQRDTLGQGQTDTLGQGQTDILGRGHPKRLRPWVTHSGLEQEEKR